MIIAVFLTVMVFAVFKILCGVTAVAAVYIMIYGKTSFERFGASLALIVCLVGLIS